MAFKEKRRETGFRLLDDELGAAIKRLGQQELKETVIITNVSAHMGLGEDFAFMLQHSIGLSDNAATELRAIDDSVFVPIERQLNATRMRFLDALPGFDKHGEAESLVDFVVSSLDEAGLSERKNIKSAVVYPLTIAVFNTWKKYDIDFATEIIEGIKAKETDAELKKLIDAIASTPI